VTQVRHLLFPMPLAGLPDFSLGRGACDLPELLFPASRRGLADPPLGRVAGLYPYLCPYTTLPCSSYYLPFLGIRPLGRFASRRCRYLTGSGTPGLPSMHSLATSPLSSQTVQGFMPFSLKLQILLYLRHSKHLYLELFLATGEFERLRRFDGGLEVPC
jgi:hypothetical protein